MKQLLNKETRTTSLLLLSSILAFYFQSSAIADSKTLSELVLTAPSLQSIQQTATSLANGSKGVKELETLESSELFSEREFSFTILRETTVPAPGALDLATVVKRAKNQNYSVRGEAERKFQAKKRVDAAIGNLLPHLSAGSILSVALAGPAGLFEVVGDLLPFLFPSNWFKMKATKRLLEAEKKSFASLRGNEVFDAVSLFYSVSRDEKLALLVEAQIGWIDLIVARMRAEELSGISPAGSADYFSLNGLRLKEELSSLTELLSAEKSALLFAIAADPARESLNLQSIIFPNIGVAAPQKPDGYLGVVQTRSLELQAIGWMSEAAKITRRAITFGYLDPSSGQAIGFGMGAPVQIAKSQMNEIAILRESTSAKLRQRVVDATNLMNQSIVRYKLADQASLLSRDALLRIIQRHDLGDAQLDQSEFNSELSRIQAEILISEVKKLSEAGRYLVGKTQLDRLTLSGDYSDLELNMQLPPAQIQRNDDCDDLYDDCYQ